MKDVSITELEAAINYYRNHSPTDEQVPILCREARVLADAYAMLIIRKKTASSFLSSMILRKWCLKTTSPRQNRNRPTKQNCG